MCVSCGCGEVNEKHSRDDIVMAQIEAAARSADVDVTTVAENISDAVAQRKAAPVRK